MTRGALLRRVPPLVLLALALWNPQWPWGRTALDWVVLVDDSLSVERAAAGAAWRELAATARALPDEGRLTVLRFAGETVVETSAPLGSDEARALLDAEAPPRARPLDRAASDLEAALLEGFAQLRAGRPAAVTLLSDGVETTGDARRALGALRDAGVPVTARAVDARTGDAWIESLEAPGAARVGDVVEVAVGVAAREATRGRVVLTLAGDGGQPVEATRPVELQRGGVARLEFSVPLRQRGLARMEASLEIAGAPDSRAARDRAAALVQVEGEPRSLVISRRPPGDRSAWRAAAERSGELVWQRPEAFEVQWGEPGASRLSPEWVVLDDLAVADLSDASWQRIERWVRSEGSGLLVLGGPHAFASGGYRHSRLESLLPVTAEAREPREPAAVLFLLDSSGSMDRDREGNDRLELARRAVAETLRSIDADDRVGLSTFAREPRPIVPVGRLGSDPARFTATLPRASGGTRLAPALDHAVEVLGRTDAARRILVLVTDGFVDAFGSEAELSEIEGALARAEIELVALAVGADVGLGVLERLVGGGPSPGPGAGRVLRVDRVALLPRFMRRAVDERLEPVEAGPLRPRKVAALPFSAAALDGDWPPLAATAVTRPRAGAVVYLESPEGHPLFAAHHAGAGRVAVLPGGLGAWAADWNDWAGLEALASGLQQWLARPVGDPRLRLRARDEAAGLRVEIDALGPGGEWSDAASVTLHSLDPAGEERVRQLEAVAPGRFEGVLPARLTGAHRLAASLDHPDARGAWDERATAVRTLLRSGDRERRPREPGVDPLGDWQREGLLALWRAGEAPIAPTPPRGHLRLRPWLAGAALLAYLLVLSSEESGRAGRRVRRAAAAGSSEGATGLGGVSTVSSPPGG